MTGIRRGTKGKPYPVLQVEWLLAHGYPAHVNRAGRAIVARSAIEGQRPPPPSRPIPNGRLTPGGHEHGAQAYPQSPAARHARAPPRRQDLLLL
ncbi:DUF4224 domain-containing protein [Achromobacter spanius]|uniref:DUF4224 domain-containing protein n=1 Tax=Achromobacter spanius TaxID=217203 RepID=UPI003A945C38